MYSNQPFLANLLVESGAVDSGAVQALRAEQPGLTDEVSILLNRKQVTETAVAKCVAFNSGYQQVELSRYQFPEGVQHCIDKDVAEKYKVVPLGDDGMERSKGQNDMLPGLAAAAFAPERS